MIFRKRRQALYHEPNTLEAVAQYHHLFQLPIPASPSLPSNERFQLQISLLQEEIGRLKTAIERKRSLATVANTFANLQYAISGSVLEFGIGGLFLSLFDEVHRSQMSKICNSLSEAEATQRFYRRKKGTESILEQVTPTIGNIDGPANSKWLVLRSKDQKMLKSIKYAPANLGILLSRAIEANSRNSNTFSNDEGGNYESLNSLALPSLWLLASPGALSSVADFHAALNGSTLPSTKPHWATKERCQWRLSVLECKLRELERALGQIGVEQVGPQCEDTLVQVAHSLTSMQYCLSGAILEFGMASIFQSIFDEVHRSRMSEACETAEEAEETIRHYLQRNQRQEALHQVETIPEEHPEEDDEAEKSKDCAGYYAKQRQMQHGGSKWLIYRKGTNQVLKSAKYSPANLGGILISSSSTPPNGQIHPTNHRKDEIAARGR